MSEEERYRYQGEKDEKQEKEEEKEEKSWDEKWRRDPLNAAVWAVILIWAGVVWLANNLNMLGWIPFLEPWSIFFLGAGGILLLEVLLRLLLPAYRQPVAGSLILAAIFLAIGLGSIFDWKCIFPVALIGVGAYLLFSGLVRRRE
jgi:hypothetical protein